MTFSSEWNERYLANTHLSVWPWTDVVSLVHRHCPEIALGRGRVLELGCGAGANIPLFRSFGVQYAAIEGSDAMVNRLAQRWPDLAASIVCADFTSAQPFDGPFDLVVDRASLTHNDTISIKRALGLVIDSLKVDGLFIGVDWFSRNHSDAMRGSLVGDEYTRTGYNTGQFGGVGKVHFSDEPHLRDLFSSFEIVYLEEKFVRRHYPQDSHQFASWNIVARKIHA